MFDRFSETDLKHIFQDARPIQCSELIRGTGEWEDVAFFSGNRKFGNWYRSNFDEVMNNVAVFTFEGECGFEQARLRLTTKFPVNEGSVHDDGQVGFHDSRARANPPVSTSFNVYTKAYDFELPYLFKGKDENGGSIYTFSPQRVSDRYLTHVTSRWECKALTQEYLTYDFLVCHTYLFGYEPAEIKPDRIQHTTQFGGSAYFILSNGKEASW